MKFLSILILVVACAGTAAYAQSPATDTLIWTTSQVTDVKNNAAARSFASTFKTYANQTTDWIQNSGAVSYHFIVTSINGSWSSVASDGTLEYSVSCGSYVTGSITFTREAGQLTARLKTFSEGEPDLDLLFTISTVELLQP